MKMAQKDDTVRNHSKAPGEFLWRVRWSVEVPEVFDLVRIKPRFDVCEEAAVDFQTRFQAAHEIEDGGAVPLAHLLGRIEAKANVMVAPYANRCHVTKQPHRFLNAFAHFTHVAQDYEAVGTVLLQHGDGL